MSHLKASVLDSGGLLDPSRKGHLSDREEGKKCVLGHRHAATPLKHDVQLRGGQPDAGGAEDVVEVLRHEEPRVVGVGRGSQRGVTRIRMFFWDGGPVLPVQR